MDPKNVELSADEYRQRSADKNANYSLGLGVLSLFCLCFTGLPAVLLGLISLKHASDSGRRKAKAGIGLGAVMTVFTLLFSVWTDHQEEQQREKAEAARIAEEQRQADERAARVAELEASAESNGAKASESLALMDQHLSKGDELAAREALGAALDVLGPYIELDVSTPPIAEVRASLQPKESHLAALASVAKADELAASKEYIAADSALQVAINSLDAVGEDYPNQRAASTLKKSAERTKRQLASKVKKQEEEIAALAALIALCGKESPTPDPWDGGIIAVDSFMKQSAHDPSSIDSENCTVPRLTNKCWETSCTVRGKNAFGALVANRYTFYIGKDPQYPSLHLVLDVVE